jgi:hypothetical protein
MMKNGLLTVPDLLRLIFFYMSKLLPNVEDNEVHLRLEPLKSMIGKYLRAVYLNFLGFFLKFCIKIFFCIKVLNGRL